MNEKNKSIANIIVAAVIVFGMSIWCFIKPATDVSLSERRQLKQLPEVSVDTLLGLNGKKTFMDEFEKYAADQFPMRETFRAINSVTSLYVLGKQEINDLYTSDGYIAKLEYEIHQEDVDWSLNRLNYIKEKYLANSNAYMAIIPDKNYYLAEQAGVPYLDYEKFIELFKKGTEGYAGIESFATYIELKDKLSLENYYKTDTHWKQETSVDLAAQISKAMGNDYEYSFNENSLDKDFSGVYYGQLALPVSKDKISYLTGSYIDNLVVTCLDTGKPEDIGVYNFEKLEGWDMYEFFLSGSKSLITIDNPSATSDKELVIFRDSFTSSMAPLLVGNYKKVTLVDIRYINPGMLKLFVKFDGNDVLFLYSAQVLNNSVGQFIN